MYKYVKNKRPEFLSPLLGIHHKGEFYYPHVLHATLNLDRPTGDTSTFGEHVHNVYHLVLYTQSEGHYRHNGIMHKAMPGTLALISPGEPHDFYTCRQEAMYCEVALVYEATEQRSLTMSFEELLSYYVGQKVHLRKDIERLNDQQILELRLHLVELVDYLQSNAGLAEFHVQRVLMQIMEFIITNLCHVKTEHPQPAQVGLRQVKQFIEAHYDESLSIEGMSQQARMSRGHFFRKFRAAYGVSPIAYQQSVRIEAAKNLLRATNLLCNDIARRVGYENISLFHRLFKRNVGMSPRCYRTELIKDIKLSGRKRHEKTPCGLDMAG